MKDIEKIVNNLEEIIRVLKENKNDDTETTGDSVKKFIESVTKPGHVVDFSHIAPPVGDPYIPTPQPDIKYFSITDEDNILGDGRYSKYPLFIKYENNSNYLIINYVIMKEFLYRDDIEIRILFSLKEGTGACAVFKPSDVRVHVGTTTLTGKKKDGTIVEIRAENWKKLNFARVTIQKIPKNNLRK